MAFYEYKAVDKDNKKHVGKIETDSESSAADVLNEKGWTILFLRPKRAGFSLASFGSLNNISFSFFVSVKDIMVFFRQFSVLVEANISLVSALAIMTRQIENVKLQKAVSDIASSVDGGTSLSEAMLKHNDIFNNFWINVIRSGESSGKLDETLNYLADEIEKEYDLMAKLKGAMIYPVFVLSGLFVVGILMMVFILPKITDMLTSTGQDLPISTTILIATSDFLSNQWYIALTIFIALVSFFIWFKKSKTGRPIFDLMILRLPVFGKMFQDIYLVRFTRSLTTLLVGGVHLTQALKITASVVNNAFYQDIILRTIKEVEDGNSISTIFSQHKEIPAMVPQMMTVGEKTGKLDFVLDKITNFYSKEVDNYVSNLMQLMEPLIMVLLGIGVAIMVAAVILPMYQVATGF